MPVGTWVAWWVFSCVGRVRSLQPPGFAPTGEQRCVAAGHRPGTDVRQGSQTLVRRMRPLPAQSEPFDQRTVATDVDGLQVAQQPATLADEAEQAAPGVVVVLVFLSLI